MIRLRLSPTEEQVLRRLGEGWCTPHELKRGLWPQHTPEAVKRAVSYLKRHELVQALEREHGEAFLEQTPLGAQLLADHDRARQPLQIEGLHVV